MKKRSGEYLARESSPLAGRPRIVTACGLPTLVAVFSLAQGDGVSPRAGRKIEATSPR
ncbi:hypothetical protein BHE74_00051144, partial [Ensete ventricosum]